MKEYRLLANASFLKGEYAEAVRFYEAALRGGDAYAADNLAYMYLTGLHVAQDHEKARTLYAAASYLDGGVGYFNLALMELRGLGTPADFVRAREHMERAAEQGCIDAMLYLGLAYLRGCMYDPVHIECIHYIPFYRVVRRNLDVLLLDGEGGDDALEDARWDAIEQSMERSVDMYRKIQDLPESDEYAEQRSAGTFMLGVSLVEGAHHYDPQRGYKLLNAAATVGGSYDSALYLLQNRSAAEYYGVDIKKIRMLAAAGHFGEDPTLVQ